VHPVDSHYTDKTQIIHSGKWIPKLR